MNYRTIDAFDRTGLVKTVYTMAEGQSYGVNENADPMEYRQVGELFHVTEQDMLRLVQAHTTVVRVIEKKHGGDGITRIAPDDCDGMITNGTGVMLCTVEQDCVPVYLLDPVHKAIGMLHSGWKGTAGCISVRAIRLMQERYGTSPKDLMVAFGPCICGKCYEVGGELKDEFRSEYTEDEIESFFAPKADGKFLLDLTKAIGISVKKMGVIESNIYDAPCCTYESPDLYSWRRDHNKNVKMLTGMVLL